MNMSVCLYSHIIIYVMKMSVSCFSCHMIIYVMKIEPWNLLSIGEKQAIIQKAEGQRQSIILASEAAKMDQVNRAEGKSLLKF